MTKKNKVINLFDRVHVEEDESKKYSVALNGLILPFETRFPEDYDMEDVIEFGINAWNMANMKGIVPAKEFNKIMESGGMPLTEKTLLNQMMQYKSKSYADFDRFIIDFELYDIDDEVRLTVITQGKEEFLMDMMNGFERDTPFNESDAEEAYINRSALMLTPKAPLLEWLKSLDIDFEEAFIQEANTYLLDENINDTEKWLQKNLMSFLRWN